MDISFKPNNIHPSWDDFIKRKDIIEELKKIENSIGTNYFPKKENVLRFLSQDIQNIKCIIVGMEPYPTSFINKNGIEEPIATGRSFEVAILKNENWNYKIKQSSLRNILKTLYYNETNTIKSLEEIRKEINDKKFKILNPTELFDSLEKQGVMFLNATLTVEKENVDSHRKYWTYFMNELIKYIESNNKNIKWFLWGDKAQKRFIPEIKNKDNIICCQHPRLAGFVKENCFKEIKNINWTQ